MKKYVFIVIALIIAFLFAACSTSEEELQAEYDAGYADAASYFVENHSDCKTDEDVKKAYEKGYGDGFNEANEDATYYTEEDLTESFFKGYEEGYTRGYEDGSNKRPFNLDY